MSMRRIAVLAAVHSNQLNNTPAGGNYNMSVSHGKMGRFETDTHGNVNVLLGGAMMSGLVLMIVFICYCCHRNINKQRPQEYTPYWRTEPDVQSLEIFTMDAHSLGRFLGTPQCWERVGTGEEATTMSLPCLTTTGPPPAYESLIFNQHGGSLPSPSDKKDDSTSETILPIVNVEEEQNSKKEDDEGLPSYEAALKLEAHGYV